MKNIYKKFTQHNKKIYLLLSLLFLLFFNLFNMISISAITSSTRDVYSIIDEGDICLFSKYQENNDFYKKYKDEFINVGLSTLHNWDSNNTNRNIARMPVFFMDNIAEDECIIDYDTYIYNSLPEYVLILNDNDGTTSTEIKITKKDSKIPGVFVNKKYYNPYEHLNYYGLIVTKENKKDIANYYNIKYTWTLITYYGDLGVYNRNLRDKSWQEVDVEYSLILFNIIENFILFMIILSYISINKKDLYILKVYGFSHKKLNKITFARIFLIEIITFTTSLALTYFISLIYNSLKEKTYTGMYFSNAFLISTFLNLLFILIMTYAFNNIFINKIEKKEDKYI